MTIGDFARMTFLSVTALRYYHEVGLLPPAEIDVETGYRRYGVEQVPTAQVIRRLRELGMSLDDVRVVMDAVDVSSRNEAISGHLRKMEGELERTRATVRALRLLLDEEPPPDLPIAYRAIGPMETLAIRADVRNAEMFAWLDSAFAELRSATDALEAVRVGPEAALYSNELLEEEQGEIVALVPIESGAQPPTGRVEQLRLPRVEYAIAVHVGSVDDIDLTYAALGAVVAERAIGVQGPIREDYLVGSLDTSDESEHRTEVCWPVFQTTSSG